MGVKVVGIVGSYRKGRTIDSAVSAVLEGAEAAGAKTKKIYLLDMRIEFCSNCRSCMQEKGGPARGKCVHNDDMDGILAEIDQADAIVLAAPVNVGNVTAIMKRFVERLAPYAYWPWGEAPAPAPRPPG
ncbi:MAG: flavodoxin family protein [Planctomycetota bacterium]